MNLKIKKTLGLLLSILMIISAIPAGASAAKLAGKGTEKEPYLISSAADMKLFASEVNAGDSFSGKYVSLKADISLDSKYVPAGKKTAPFSGTFSGNSHAVDIDGITCDYAGLFGAVKNAVIKDVSVSGEVNAVISYAGAVAAYSENSVISGCIGSASVYGDKYTGGIVGYMNIGEIKNCSVTSDATVGGYENMTGGIAGYSTGDITGCRNEAYTFGVKNTGGIAGYSTGTIKNCENLSHTEAENDNCGGIAGYSEGKINVCKNTGTVSGKGKTGGILGAGYNADLLYCENSGEVNAGGEFSAGIAAYMTNGSIKRGLFSGSVVSSADYAGGIAGYIKNTEVTECFSSSEVTGAKNTAVALCGLNGGKVSSCYYVDNGKSAFAGGAASDTVYAVNNADVLDSSIYAGWDFENIWAVNSIHSQYPLLNETGFHKFKLVSSVEPTCTEKGLRKYICTVCNETVDRVVPAQGHDFELKTSKEATCLENGYEDYRCKKCGETKSIVIKAEGHKDENKDNVCDVCGKKLDPLNPEHPEDGTNFFQAIIDVFTNLFNIILNLIHNIQDAIGNIKK